MFTSPIFALDLATRTGWAYGRPGDSPRSGSIRFAPPGASRAKIYRELRLWLDAWASAEEIALCVFEAPASAEMFHGRTNTDTLRLLIGLAEHVDELLYDRGIQVREAPVFEVRRHFLGTNRLKRDEAKRQTIAKCRAMGWAPCDDNAADALALWSYQVSILRPEFAIRPTPLFGYGG